MYLWLPDASVLFIDGTVGMWHMLGNIICLDSSSLPGNRKCWFCISSVLSASVFTNIAELGPIGDSYSRKPSIGGHNGMVVEFARQDVEWIDAGGAWGLSPDTEHFPRIACASTQNAFTSLGLVSGAYELIPQGNRLQLLSGTQIYSL